MRHSIIGASLLLFAGGAFAQWRDDDWGRRRDGRWPDGGFGQGSPVVVDRVLSRLERSRSYFAVNGHDRRHFERARQDLIRFREGWFRGKFERGRLDGAIDHLKDIAGSDRVHPRERQAFWNDIYALRDFRASRGQSNAGWGGWGGGRRWPDSRW